MNRRQRSGKFVNAIDENRVPLVTRKIYCYQWHLTFIFVLVVIIVTRKLWGLWHNCKRASHPSE